jgi:hypothetical protein
LSRKAKNQGSVILSFIYKKKGIYTHDFNKCSTKQPRDQGDGLKIQSRPKLVVKPKISLKKNKEGEMDK